jgi:hypothetical protein
MAKDRGEFYDYYEDWAGKQFKHLLDYYEIDAGRQRITQPTVYVPFGSYANTSDENEDPTYMGFDFYINWNDSPLFNGSVEAFISTFGGLGNSEVGSRAGIISEFKKQFLRFFKVDSPETAGGVPKFLGKNSPKSYYLKSLKGLEFLSESGDSAKSKSFVNYGTEFIDMTFNEDVSQNLGYLAALYKALSWSRVNGKQIIPENLLRFDVTINITEARKMNRLVYNEENKQVDVYADKISNYQYTLYECQFFFTSFPHGSQVNNDAPTMITDYTIKFNFKHSTLKFNKLILDRGSYQTKTELPIDNSMLNIGIISPRKTNNNTLVESRSSSQPDSTPNFPNNQSNVTESARNVRNQASNPTTTATTAAINTTANAITGAANALGAPTDLQSVNLTALSNQLQNIVGGGAQNNTGSNESTSFQGPDDSNQPNFLELAEAGLLGENSNIGIDPVNTNGGEPISASIASQNNIIKELKKYIRDEETIKVVLPDGGGILGEANRNDSLSQASDGDLGEGSSDEADSMDQINAQNEALEKNSKAKSILDNLNKIGAKAAGNVKQSQRNLGMLNNLQGAQLLRNAESLLNQSVTGRSPGIEKFGNLLLGRGKRALRTEIYRQASLVDRTLRNVRNERNKRNER